MTMKKRHTFFYKLLLPLTTLFCRLKFGYTYTKAENLPKNYIVLSNHVTDYDMLLVGASFRRQMYFVGSEHIARWKFLSKLLNFTFAPIMRPKGSVASGTVLEILRRVKKGANICLFAEGVRSWDGRTCPILPSTGKMVKKAGCGLVTYKIVGGYFASPMWSTSNTRRGYIHGAPVRVFTAEQLKAMTVDEINEVIRTDLWEDAYARQLADPRPYKGKRLAEPFENLLHVCPACGVLDTITSRDDTISCTACGHSFTYDEYGMLHGTRFDTVQAIADWQREQTAIHASENVTYSTPGVTITSVENHVETPVTSGTVTMNRDYLRCGDLEIPMENISELANHGRHAIVFTAGTNYYELLTGDDQNAMKYFFYYHACKSLAKTVKEG